jgi:hypothetical protein
VVVRKPWGVVVRVPEQAARRMIRSHTGHRSAPAFATTAMREVRRGEQLPPRNARLEQRVVRYLSAAERQAYRVDIDDHGLVRSADGNLYNTPRAEFGGGIWVMRGNGRFYASAGIRLTHSSLAGGGTVAAAGTWNVEDGRITLLTDLSGHYEPPHALTRQAVQELRRLGVHLPDEVIKLYQDAIVSDVPGAGDIRPSGRPPVPVRAVLPAAFEVREVDGDTWLAPRDSGVDLSELAGWAGEPVPGTLHVGSPGEVHFGHPVLSAEQGAQWVEALPDGTPRPTRVVFHQPGSSFVDSQALADRLGVPVTVPVVDPDAGGNQEMIDDADDLWRPIATSLTYLPAGAPGAAPWPVVGFRPVGGWIRRGLLSAVDGGTFLLPAAGGHPEHTVEVVRSGLLISPGSAPADPRMREIAHAAPLNNNGPVIHQHPGAAPEQVAALQAGLNRFLRGRAVLEALPPVTQAPAAGPSTGPSVMAPTVPAEAGSADSDVTYFGASAVPVVSAAGVSVLAGLTGRRVGGLVGSTVELPHLEDPAVAGSLVLAEGELAGDWDWVGLLAGEVGVTRAELASGLRGVFSGRPVRVSVGGRSVEISGRLGAEEEGDGPALRAGVAHWRQGVFAIRDLTSGVVRKFDAPVLLRSSPGPPVPAGVAEAGAVPVAGGDVTAFGSSSRRPMSGDGDTFRLTADDTVHFRRGRAGSSGPSGGLTVTMFDSAGQPVTNGSGAVPAAGSEVVTEAGPPAGSEVVAEAGPPAGSEVVAEAGPPAGSGAGPNVGSGAVAEAVPNAGSGAEPEAVPNAGSGAEPEAGPDGRSEAGAGPRARGGAAIGLRWWWWAGSGGTSRRRRRGWSRAARWSGCSWMRGWCVPGVAGGCWVVRWTWSWWIRRWRTRRMTRWSRSWAGGRSRVAGGGWPGRVGCCRWRCSARSWSPSGTRCRRTRTRTRTRRCRRGRGRSGAGAGRGRWRWWSVTPRPWRRMVGRCWSSRPGSRRAGRVGRAPSTARGTPRCLSRRAAGGVGGPVPGRGGGPGRGGVGSR